MMPLITQDFLKSILFYQPESGLFFWKVGSPQRKEGGIAGKVSSSGYINISIKNKMYRAHRLAWVYMTGEQPPASIDHINRDRSDNRWANLRKASVPENQWNIGKKSHNKSGVKGVHWSTRDKVWKAACRVNGVFHHVGSFRSLDAAAVAVQEFRAKHHGEFASN